jgi:4-aminobutyrate aminotransferase-like enzyme
LIVSSTIDQRKDSFYQLFKVRKILYVLKGFSSSLPISGVIGKANVLDIYGPNEMTSTHSANPICCAAALANINIIEKEKLIQNAAQVGKTLKNKLASIKE